MPHRLALLLAALALVACGEVPTGETMDTWSAPPPPPGSLIDHARWSPAGSPSPFHAPPPGVATGCALEAARIEAEVLELETDRCAWIELSQPSRLDVSAGEALELTLWHLALTAPEPTTAHVAVALGDAVLWEREVIIPSEAAVYEATIEAPEDAPAGTPVTLHLHNHGANSWSFAELRRLP